MQSSPRFFLSDRVLARFLLGLGGVTGAVFLLILLFLVLYSAPLMANYTWLDFFGLQWFPLEGLYGLVPMVLASLFLLCGVLILGVPIAFLCAIFLNGLPGCPESVRQGFQILVQIFAGIPSVIFGFWGLTVLVPLVTAYQPPGASLFSAIVLLTFMVLPTFILTVSSALNAVPNTLLAGARALGLSRTSQILYVSIPAARQGIYAGVLLGLARVVGETMAVVMVAGNVVQIPSSVFDPVRVLTANIALEMAYAVDTHRASLYGTGLLLTLMVSVLATFASEKSS